MERFVFIILIIGSWTFDTYGQDCKYSVDKIDEFTNHRILETRSKLLGKRGLGLYNNTYVVGKKIDSLRAIIIGLSDNDIFTLREDNAVIFKFTNGETLSLFFRKAVIADYSNVNSMTYWHATQFIPLTEFEFEKLTKNTVSKVRIQTNKSNEDFDVKEKDAKNLIEILNCIK